MEDSVLQKLLTINREFYQTFASDFSSTRMRLQPGVLKILTSVPRQSNILDIGCGNGELAHWLAEKGQRGVYLGLDFSPGLVEIARARLNTNSKKKKGEINQGDSFDAGSFNFLQADLTSQSWDLKVQDFLESNLITNRLDFVFAFSTLHHLPGKEIQSRTCKKIHTLLNENGYLIHSNWQFLNSERLRRRIQPWSTVNLSQDNVDAGDCLLDWRQGGYGLRYAHHFSEDELFALALTTGFEVINSFYSDGKVENLGLYQIWKKIKQHTGNLERGSDSNSICLPSD